ncbi:MAG TPA: MOSC domain-containing protein [Roseiflexaceae bacterium]|nr:MOSC domain-containing protein [Roseiflexaceae bacterium]
MRVLSVNRGRVTPIANAKAIGVTGIYKGPQTGPVAVGALGLDGDAICDTENHGGVDQAVYVYGEPDYRWWAAELGRELLPGTFGENLTLSDMESAAMAAGDRLLIGDLILEITAPRIPCVTLARRMEDPAFLKRFRAAERPGVYCRVIRAGAVQAGDSVRYEPYPGERLGVIEQFRGFFEQRWDEATIRRHLAAPIAIRDRVEKEQQLATLLAEADRQP